MQTQYLLSPNGRRRSCANALRIYRLANLRRQCSGARQTVRVLTSDMCTAADAFSASPLVRTVCTVEDGCRLLYIACCAGTRSSSGMCELSEVLRSWGWARQFYELIHSPLPDPEEAWAHETAKLNVADSKSHPSRVEVWRTARLLSRDGSTFGSRYSTAP